MRGGPGGGPGSPGGGAAPPGPPYIGRPASKMLTANSGAVGVRGQGGWQAPSPCSFVGRGVRDGARGVPGGGGRGGAAPAAPAAVAPPVPGCLGQNSGPRCGAG